MTLAGAIVPHAPLLLPELSSPEVESAARRIRAAVASLAWPEAELAVVVSPHGRATGIYGTVRGSLRELGVPGVEIDVSAAGAAAELARLWRSERLDGPVDHGVVVPLRLWPGRVPVVALALADDAPEIAVEHARGLALALRKLGATRALVVLTSANTSPALSSRAPFTEIDEAVRAERKLLFGLERDAGAAADLAGEMAHVARSCAAGPLTVFGELFRGAPTDVLAYESPVGVGYLVARADAAA